MRGTPFLQRSFLIFQYLSRSDSWLRSRWIRGSGHAMGPLALGVCSHIPGKGSTTHSRPPCTGTNCPRGNEKAREWHSRLAVPGTLAAPCLQGSAKGVESRSPLKSSSVSFQQCSQSPTCQLPINKALQQRPCVLFLVALPFDAICMTGGLSGLRSATRDCPICSEPPTLLVLDGHQQGEEQPQRLPGAECSPRARCSAGRATATTSLSFQKIATHSRVGSRARALTNAVRREARARQAAVHHSQPAGRRGRELGRARPCASVPCSSPGGGRPCHCL